MASDDLKNVVASVIIHFRDNLGSVSAIDIPGEGLNTKELPEWFQPTLLGPVSAPMRRGERFETYLLNCNCFARTGTDATGAQVKNIWRHWEMAGAFRDAFQGVDVPVQDWDADGDPVIGYMRFEEVDVREVGDLRETKLQQAAASVSGVIIT